MGFNNTYSGRSTMRRTSIVLAAAAAGLIAASSARAQHAELVLFGEPNPAAAAAPAEHRFVHPVTSPYFHEDSFITSDIRAWYIYHDLPNTNLGGHVEVVAAQLRIALTDQLQLVAYKDGYIMFEDEVVKDDDFMDTAAGLKWNFIQDWENQFHMAAGVGYEFPTGSDDVLQRDEEWRIWGSANKGFDRLHLGATVNYFIGPDKNDGKTGNSNHLMWHLHADYYVVEYFSPVVEINGYHVLNNGGEALPFSGVDVANLGGSSGDSVITLGVGAEIRPWKNTAVRVAYETPLTDAEDLWGYRWTMSLVYSF